MTIRSFATTSTLLIVLLASAGSIGSATQAEADAAIAPAQSTDGAWFLTGRTLPAPLAVKPLNLCGSDRAWPTGLWFRGP